MRGGGFGREKRGGGGVVLVVFVFAQMALDCLLRTYIRADQMLVLSVSIRIASARLTGIERESRV